jgi:putative intracellular protease/amidase
MKRLLLSASLFLACVPAAFAAETSSHLTPPKSGTIKVAFVISEGATLIDFAGPWEVFQDVMLDKAGNDMDAATPFELYTVAPSKDPIHTSGSHHPGMTVTPDYSFADAPMPDIVVIGAQSGGPGLSEWLQKVHGQDKIIMSVCTGAFKVAKAGLLDGESTTTHHWYYDKFAEEYPQAKLVKSVRYVQASPILFSAGGLSSGMDLALHIVAGYYGTDVAQKTADYMEYEGTGWKTNQGISELTTPVSHEEWQGETASGLAIQMHVAIKGMGASFTATTDSPTQHVTGASTTIKTDGDNVSIGFAIAGHPATFDGTANQGGDTLTGTYTQDGKSSPLTLVKQKPKG